jgi:hypothetical protein
MELSQISVFGSAKAVPRQEALLVLVQLEESRARSLESAAKEDLD